MRSWHAEAVHKEAQENLRSAALCSKEFCCEDDDQSSRIFLKEGKLSRVFRFLDSQQ
jgi:hypothetical protein